MMKNNYVLNKSNEIELDKNYSMEELIELINEQVEIVRSNLDDQEEILNEDYIDLNSSLKDIEESIIRLNKHVSNIETSSLIKESLNNDSILRLDLSLTELSVLELFSNLTDEDDILLEEVNLLRDYLLTLKRYLIDKEIIKSFKDFEYSDICSE